MNKNLVSLLVVGLLLVILGLLYGKRLMREYQFHQTISEMLEHTKGGDVTKMMGFVVKSQRQQAVKISSAVLFSDYHTHIHSLKLTSVHWLSDDTVSALVTCKLDYEGVNPIYQGRLLWHFDQGKWDWNFLGSYVGEYAGLEEPTWVKLDEMLSTMENY